MLRRIPIRFPPLADEALDSWFAAYAARLHLPMNVAAEALGLAPTFLLQPPAVMAMGHCPPDPGPLAFAAGLPAAEIGNLWKPLGRYDRVMRGGRPWLMRLLRPLRWSRYCPRCLTESGGRWHVSWRLPWMTACPRHRVFLLSKCPRCGLQVRRRRFLVTRELPQTTACTNTTPVGWDGARCEMDLSSTACPYPVPARVLELQQRLCHVLKPGLDDEEFLGIVHQLVDLATIACSGVDPRRMGPEILAKPEALAATLVNADQILRDPTERRLSELATADVRERPIPLPPHLQTASRGLASRVLTIRDPHLRPTDRLRWRTTTVGRRPAGNTAKGSTRARCAPLALWPDWGVRLQPRVGSRFDEFRTVAAGCLRLPGSTAPLARLLEEQEMNFASIMSTTLQEIANSANGTAVLRVLTELSDRLDLEGGPIDYRRRREIASRAILLTGPEWDQMCLDAGAHVGGARKLWFARLWIWETMTAGRIDQAPREIRATDNHTRSIYNYQFTLGLRAPEVRLLRTRARKILDDNGCDDEPISWSPPVEWVDLQGVPCPDPFSLDSSHIIRQLRDGVAPSDLAERLGTTIAHIRLLGRANPPEPKRRSQRGARRALPPLVAGERLRMRIAAGHTLRSLAAEHQVGRGALARELGRQGIRVPPGRRPIKVDTEWLRTEYVDRRRTLTEIAAEIGTSPANMARIAHARGVPVRGRGVVTNAASVRSMAYPEPLASAIVGRGGIQRLQRFQVVARVPSLNQAAKILDVSPSRISVQIAKLEAAAGAPLITRSPRTHQPQQVTELGRRLLSQADELLGPHPRAPAPLPQPLRSALMAFRGEGLVRDFQIAARLPTLVDAAKFLGKGPYALDATIRRLEATCGGLFVLRFSPHEPHRLTTTGSHLLGQADHHLGPPAAFRPPAPAGSPKEDHLQPK